MASLEEFRSHCRAMGGRVTQKNIHLTDDQRALFRTLAREVDTYLALGTDTTEVHPDEQPIDFEELTDA